MSRSPRITFVLLITLALLAPESLFARQSESLPSDSASFVEARQEWMQAEHAMRRSAKVPLDSLERAADAVLTRLKKPWNDLPTWQYPPANLFAEVRAAYDTTTLLTIMDRLPKGAMLHAHPSATGSFRFLLEATYDPHVWVFRGPDSTWQPTGTLRWSDTSPGPAWKRVVDLRTAAEDTSAFDRRIFESITLGAEDYGDGDIWDEFENNFNRIRRLESAPANRKAYLLSTCRQLAEQHVQYAEFHTGVGDSNRVVMWRSIRDSVRLEYPDFDLKLIAAFSRWGRGHSLADYLKRVADLRKQYPDLVAGFDLVAEEDKAGSNLEFMPDILEARRYADSIGVTLTPYLHSGESNRLDNENLFDAILLGAKRIGHGYALWTHPLLLQKVIDRKIALEVCPLSNQSLGYVVDLRNHPAVEYLARGVPMVLSPDDPGMMRYRWAYDWVAATSAWDLSIADIKSLILDSFVFSAMTPEEQTRALNVWQEQWQAWVAWVAREGWKKE